MAAKPKACNKKPAAKKPAGKLVRDGQRGGDATPKDVEDMKELGRRCADLPVVQDYVKKLCDGMATLVEAYAEFTNQSKDLMLQKCFCLPGKQPHMTGNVNGRDIAAVIKRGNIRERMTILANFWNHGCEAAMWGASDDASMLGVIRPERVEQIRTRVRQSTGLDIATFNQIVCNGLTCHLPCDIALGSRDNPVALSRTPMFPYKDVVRVKRSEAGALVQTFGDAYPPLSEREIEYMSLNNPTSATPLPWVTGAMMWSASNQSDNLYANIAEKYGHVTVAGPSGTTNEVLAVCSMLKPFDIDLSMLAHMAWMCNPPHHSPFEILMAGIPFGCKYNATASAYTFVEDLIQQHGTARGGGKRSSKTPAKRVAKKPVARK
jgi:hypothetical protein